MDKKLYNFTDSLSEKELGSFDSELEQIARASKIGQAEKNRILSSAMRKAGFEMKETTKKRTFKKKRIIAAAAAAAMLAVGGTAAAVGISFINRDSIVHNFGESAPDKLEELGQVANITTENEHFRITADMIICDGINLRAYCTVEALDDTGKEAMGLSPECIVYIPPEVNFHYEGENEKLTFGQSMGSSWLAEQNRYYEYEDGGSDDLDDTRAYFEMDLPVYKLDTAKRLTADFSTAKLDGDTEYMNGLSITFGLEKNIETTTFVSPDGDKIYMSPVGITTDIGVDYTEGNADSRLYIGYTMSDGTETDMQPASYFGDEAHTYIVFYELTDPNDYQAVKIGDILGNGTVYTKSE